MTFRALRRYALICIPIAFAACGLYAQDSSQKPPQPGIPASTTNTFVRSASSGARGSEHIPDPPPLSTIQDHWKLFVDETFGPISAGGTVFNAGFSQLTNSDPRYGKNGAAFGQRIGASAADIASQNFFGDFLVGSALHEDPRYFRRGEQYTFRQRFSYAISRALLIRTDSGQTTFNWDNVIGSAMSTGFSNLYYPPASRTGGAMLIHFSTSIADNGFVNLAPEFWPDFHRKFFHRHHHQSADSGK